MVCIPQQVRRNEQKRDGERDEAPSAAERVACARVAPGIDRHAEHEIGRGIFGEETEADTRADQRREAPSRLSRSA